VLVEAKGHVDPMILVFSILEVIERELRTNDKSKSCSFIDDE
jgi:hypothetical protein